MIVVRTASTSIPFFFFFFFFLRFYTFKVDEERTIRIFTRLKLQDFVRK